MIYVSFLFTLILIIPDVSFVHKSLYFSLFCFSGHTFVSLKDMKIVFLTEAVRRILFHIRMIQKMGGLTFVKSLLSYPLFNVSYEIRTCHFLSVKLLGILNEVQVSSWLLVHDELLTCDFLQTCSSSIPLLPSCVYILCRNQSQTIFIVQFCSFPLSLWKRN